MMKEQIALPEPIWAQPQCQLGEHFLRWWARLIFAYVAFNYSTETWLISSCLDFMGADAGVHCRAGDWCWVNILEENEDKEI